MKKADLHFHSTYSDGQHSIEWVVEKAKAADVGLAVLTDHDGVKGFEEFKAAVNGAWPCICASELSCTTSKGAELHLLSYGIDPEDGEVMNYLTQFEKERSDRFYKMIDLLKANGVAVDVEPVLKNVKGVLGRPHVADALMAAGSVQSRQEAFERYIGEGKPYFVKKWRFPVETALEMARNKNWKTSLAHPGPYHFHEPFISELKDLGLDAIEVIHPKHSKADQTYYRHMAANLGLQVTGGSDFHTFKTDKVGSSPSVGRTTYSEQQARDFLGELL